MPQHISAAGRRGLRPRHAVPLLRCRRAHPATGRDGRRRPRQGVRPGQPAVGCRAGAGAQCAHRSRIAWRRRAGHHGTDEPDGSTPDRWRAAPVSALQQGHPAGARSEGILRSQGARAAAAPQPLQRHRQQPGAEHQGKPGRFARSHQYPMDRHGHRYRPQLADLARHAIITAGGSRADRHGTNACCRTCASGSITRPAGAKTAWCSTCRRRWRSRWACRTRLPSGRASSSCSATTARRALSRCSTRSSCRTCASCVFPADADRPRRLNERFEVRQELLEAVDEDVFDRQPQAILEVFELHAAPSRAERHRRDAPCARYGDPPVASMQPFAPIPSIAPVSSRCSAMAQASPMR